MHSNPYHPPLLVPYLADGNSDLAYDGKGLLTFPDCIKVGMGSAVAFLTPGRPYLASKQVPHIHLI